MPPRLADFGPRYTETVLGRFPVEPWNAFSNLIFLAVIVYWILKLRKRIFDYPVLAIGLPVLFIGFAGGTIFHATRLHRIWLYLDFMPIFILILFVTAHLWLKLIPARWLALLLMFTGFALTFALRRILQNNFSFGISLGYALLASNVVIPGFLVAYRTGNRAQLFFILSLLSFAAALYFRLIDLTLGAELFPMGTHFLWHLFGGISTFLLTYFLYLIEKSRTQP